MRCVVLPPVALGDSGRGSKHHTAAAAVCLSSLHPINCQDEALLLRIRGEGVSPSLPEECGSTTSTVCVRVCVCLWEGVNAVY